MMSKFVRGIYFTLFITGVLSCSSPGETNSEANAAENAAEQTGEVKTYPNREIFWGDTHFHTAVSGDAFGGGTRLGVEDAYRLATGEQVKSSTGQLVQLKRPLDFLVITDHAEGFGIFVELAKGNEVLLADPIAKRWYDLLQGGEKEAAQLAVEIPYALANNQLPEPVTNPEKAVPIIRSAWKDYTRLAEEYNNPGVFTAVIGYEWTSVPTGNNLHRNVIFRDGKDKADQILPFSALQSEDPEKLWEFLTNYEAKTGGQVLAIPHNGNLSGGLMFSPNDHKGNPITTEYARKRAQWEPLFEISQIKGASETHPQLSPTDEFANYGIVGWDNGNLTLDILETPEQREYQYARKALLDGLRFQQTLGVNPFKIGFVSASDTHTSNPSTDEDNWWGKHTSSEPSAKRISEVTKEYNGVTRYGWQYLSNGYSAVWAESNTREALWDAMKRKETYGTTGTRISLRVFAGFDFSDADINNADYVSKGYSEGVPMGGDLSNPGNDRAPKLMIHAVKDPIWANLDRVQVVKGWIEDGKAKEKIYDVVWSGDRSVGSDGKLPPVGNTVNLEDASYSNDIGAVELKAVWEDPDFDPSELAFYYVRVLEIPTPTWCLYDKVKYKLTNISPEVPLVGQERAWSSPVWYTP